MLMRECLDLLNEWMLRYVCMNFAKMSLPLTSFSLDFWRNWYKMCMYLCVCLCVCKRWRESKRRKLLKSLKFRVLAPFLLSCHSCHQLLLSSYFCLHRLVCSKVSSSRVKKKKKENKQGSLHHKTWIER